MIMAQEKHFIKAREEFEALCDWIGQADGERLRIDQAERGLFARLLAIGLLLLRAFVAKCGEGDVGQTVEKEGRLLRRSSEPHRRRYLSIFGELTIERFVYAGAAKQKIEYVAVDEQLGLPSGECSYVLEDWLQKLCVKNSFGEGVQTLHDWLGVKPSVRSAEAINRRTSQDVIDEVHRKECATDRPTPQHKRVWVEMTRAKEDELANGKTRLFSQLGVEAERRDSDRNKPIVCLMDGERALWKAMRQWLPKRTVGILDLYHVLEYLWTAAHCFHAEKSAAADDFVAARLGMLLEGKVGYLIGSGVIEGACRHVVKDRMEQSGMRWTLAGAQSMLHLRSIYLNGDWQDFDQHRIQTEQATLYGQAA